MSFVCLLRSSRVWSAIPCGKRQHASSESLFVAEFGFVCAMYVCVCSLSLSISISVSFKHHNTCLMNAKYKKNRMNPQNSNARHRICNIRISYKTSIFNARAHIQGVPPRPYAYGLVLALQWLAIVHVVQQVCRSLR